MGSKGIATRGFGSGGHSSARLFFFFVFFYGLRVIRLLHTWALFLDLHFNVEGTDRKLKAAACPKHQSEHTCSKQP